MSENPEAADESGRKSLAEMRYVMNRAADASDFIAAAQHAWRHGRQDLGRQLAQAAIDEAREMVKRLEEAAVKL